MKPRELLARLQMLSCLCVIPNEGHANVVYVLFPTKVTCNVDNEVLNIIHMFKMVTMYVIGISDRIFLSCN